MIVRIEHPMGELAFQYEAAIARQLKDCPRSSSALTGIRLRSQRGELSLYGPSDGVGTQPGIVYVNAIHAGGHRCFHPG